MLCPEWELVNDPTCVSNVVLDFHCHGGLFSPFFVSLPAYMSAHLSICLPAGLPTYLSVCLSVCLAADGLLVMETVSVYTQVL